MFEERGLADPVRPDQRHPLAAPDPDREVAHDRPPAEALRRRAPASTTSFPDSGPPSNASRAVPARAICARRSARSSASRRTRPMLRLRRAEMPSTAQRPSALMKRSSLCRAASSSSKTLSRHSSNAAKPRSSRRTSPRSTQSVRSVSALRNARSWLTTTNAVRVAREMRLQPGDRLDVEMVGRLVEQHQLRRLGDQLRQRRPPPLAARGPLRRQHRVELQPVHRRRHPPLLAGVEPLPGERPERREGREVRVLRHVADAHPRPHEPRAGVGLDQPRHQLHQRRLARPVAPDQRDPLARMDRERDALEQRRRRRSRGGCRQASGSGARPCARAVKAAPPRRRVKRPRAPGGRSPCRRRPDRGCALAVAARARGVAIGWLARARQTARPGSTPGRRARRRRRSAPVALRTARRRRAGLSARPRGDRR